MLALPAAILIIFICLLLISGLSTTSDGGPEADKGPLFKAATPILGSPAPSLRERGLLTTHKLQLGALMSQYHLYSATAHRRFRQEVLGFITPWNRGGYETALIMHAAGKIDFVVPVWFRIIKQGKAGSDRQEVHVAGVDDVNIEWLAEMRATAPAAPSSTTPSAPSAHKTSILPRVNLEADLSEGDVATAVKLLSHLRDKYALQGFTLELNLNKIETALQMLVVMREYKMFVVLVLPPVVVPAGKGGDSMRTALSLLAKNADRLSVMTYDHQQGTGQPNAPLDWVKQVTTSLAFDREMRRKLLVGLPYYGWDSRGDDVTASKLVEWMHSIHPAQSTDGAHEPDGASSDRKNKRDLVVAWDDKAQEHVFIERALRPPGAAASTANTRAEVDSTGATTSTSTSSGSISGAEEWAEMKRCYYPTHTMLWRRLRLAEKEQVAGVAIWELGQGLPSFIDLF